MDWQTIIELDRQILAFFNGSDSLFIDGLMLTFTNGIRSVLLMCPSISSSALIPEGLPSSNMAFIRGSIL